jgi:hypothetical protein
MNHQTGVCYYCRATFERQFEHDGGCDKCLNKIEAFFEELENSADHSLPDNTALATQLTYLPDPDEEEGESVKDNSHPPVFVTVEKDEPLP